MKRHPLMRWNLAYRIRFAALSSVLLLIGAIGSSVLGDDFSTWENRMEITFSGYTAGREVLTHFPALVVLTDGSNGVDFADFETGGVDLRFTASDEATVLNYEIDTWNDADSNSWIWVQVDLLTNNTTIYAYWGRLGESAPSYTTNGATWSNGYLAVWHMQDASNAPSDSALLLNDNSGTDTGMDATVVSAKVGCGYDYSDNGRVDISNAGDLSGLSESTVTLWYYKRSQGGGDYGTLLGLNNGYDWGLRHHQTDSLDARLNGNYYNVCGNLGNAAWHHLAYVYDDAGNSLKGFLNGSAGSTVTCTDAWLTPSHIVGINNATDRAIDGILDEVRFASVVRSADWIWAEFMTMSSNDVLAVYGAASSPGPDGAPRIGNAVATNVLLQTAYLNGNLTSTGMAQTAVFAHWGVADGTTNTSGGDAWASSAEVTANASTGTVTYQATGLTSNRVYYSRFNASNSVARIWSTPSETFMTSEVWVEVASHASEIGCSAGQFTVHRHADATNAAFSVDYTVGGTATGGVHYVDNLGGSVTLAEGDASTHVTVTPLNYWQDQNDRTVELTLLEGPYAIGTQSNALMSITNVPLGSLTNVWQSLSAGNASVDGSWSLGHTPAFGEVVLLMGAVSTADLTWDAAASDTVAEWIQDADYTGTVTFETTFASYSTTFTNFAIGGDCVISNGTWTHPAHPDAIDTEQYRIMTTISGNLSLGSNATINAIGKGFDKGDGPGADSVAFSGGSHGGIGRVATTADTYGSIVRPVLPGSGGVAADGGGAVCLVVSGSTMLEEGAEIVVTGTGGTDERGAGAGGSIYLQTTSLSGGGRCEANGGDGAWNIPNSGGGGRIAVVLTEAGATFSSFTNSGGAFTAFGGDAGTGREGGAGTVYIQSGDQVLAAQPGTVIIDNNDWSVSDVYSTRIPETIDLTTFAEIIIRNEGVMEIFDHQVAFDYTNLAVRLTVESTESSVVRLSSDSGGNITFNDTVTVEGYELTINYPAVMANLQVGGTTTGRISHSTYGAGVNGSPRVDITLSGSLLVKSNGSIDVQGCGWNPQLGPGASGGDFDGGGYGGIGAQGDDGVPSAMTYGSYLNPTHYGSGGHEVNGGGAIALSVAGETTVETGGFIGAQGDAWRGGGAGGSVKIRTGTLSGGGAIHAQGGDGDYNRLNAGGGGRVAVVLTDAGATFAGFTGEIHAQGGIGPNQDGAAGSVYLQQGDAEDSAGTVIINNAEVTHSLVVTELPPQSLFSDDLGITSFVVTNLAKIQLTGDATIGVTTVYDGVMVDVDGHTLSVLPDLVVTGQTYGLGSYTAAELGSLFTDTAGGGSIVVRPMIDNANGATNVTTTTASLNGILHIADDSTAVFAFWGLTDGSTNLNSWGQTNIFAAPQSAGEFRTDVAPPELVANRMYYYRYYMTSSVRTNWAASSEVFMSGAVTVEKTVDANETGLVDGVFVVHRPDTATNEILTVWYSIGGAATPGTHYVDNLSGSTTFGVGSQDAVISVTPLDYDFSQSNETVTITLTTGLYEIGTPATAEMLILNRPLPTAPTNVWVGAGAASTATNWSLNHAPIASEDVLLGGYSSGDMSWSLANGVASWEQKDQYTGTVTIGTTFTNVSTTLTNFVIGGDCTINGGTWTHLSHPDPVDSEQYRIMVTIGGNLSMGSNAVINAIGKGFDRGDGPGADTAAFSGGSHGGIGSAATTADTYGSIDRPVLPGSGGIAGDGGGAVCLVVSGSTMLEEGAEIVVTGTGGTDERGAGAGGSIYLQTTSLSGGGRFEANGGDGAWNIPHSGGGGRIAVVLTQAGANISSFTNSGGAFTAFGGDTGIGWEGGAGTVYVQSGDQVLASQPGTVIIDNNDWSVSEFYSTRIPETIDLTTFAEIIIRNEGVMEIFDHQVAFDYTNLAARLTVESVETSIVRLPSDSGGNITFNDTVTVEGYELILNYPAAMANLQVGGTATGRILHSTYGVGAHGSPRVDISLSGNLLVKSNGSIDVQGRGWNTNLGPGGVPSESFESFDGGGYGGLGAEGDDGIPTSSTYGSYLNPTHYGSGGDKASGGGAIELSVAGETTVEPGGLIGAKGNASRGGGSGGSVNIRTGSISGGGDIHAEGGDGSSNKMNGGGGGRVAVVLTEAGARFVGFTGEIHAKGGVGPTQDGAAGSVYLQEGDESDGEGTVLINNEEVTHALVVTELPPQSLFDDDISGTSWVMTNQAKVVQIGASTIGDILIHADAFLTLGIYDLTVHSVEHDLGNASIAGQGNINRVDNYEQIIWGSPSQGSVFRFR